MTVEEQQGVSAPCECCNGSGDYPIHDKFGMERERITCPHCYGSGEEPEPPSDEPAYEYPPSTAASIQSMDHLREYLARQNRL
jgi:hypothetical protein